MDTLEARVIQKIATETEWLSYDFTPYKGEIMLVGDSAGKVYNLKVGDGVNKFVDLNYAFDSIQQNVGYIAITSNALPTPSDEVAWGMVTDGAYTFGGNPAFTVPAGHWGIANYSSGAWSLVDMGELPTAPLADDFGESTTDAATQRIVTAVKVDSENNRSLIDSIFAKYPDINDVSAFFITEEDNKVVGYLDVFGVFNLFYVESVESHSGSLETAKFKLSDSHTEETSLVEGFIKIVVDEDNKLIYGIQEDGTVNIPNLKVSNLETSDGNSGIFQRMKVLEDVVNVKISDNLQNNALNSQQVRKRKDIALTDEGTWETPKTLELNLPSVFVFQDDDTIDHYISETPDINKGGFFTRLFPVFESLNMALDLAYIGDKVFGYSLNPNNLTPVGQTAKLLFNKYGYAPVNHTLTHGYRYSIEVANFADADSLTKVSGSFANYQSTRIFNLETGKDYYWSSGEWVETPLDYVAPFYRLKSNQNISVSLHPQFNLFRQYRLNQIMGEEAGFGEVINMVNPADSQSHEIREHVLRSHMGMYSSGGFSTDNSIYITPPLASCIKRRNLDAGADEGGFNNDYDANLLATWKSEVDTAISLGRSIIYNIHAYRSEWSNYKPEELVSNGGSYPDEWVHPTGRPQDGGDYDLPKSATGITDWEEWHPCPNTRLYMLWELILFIKEQGGEINTSNYFQGLYKNMMQVGDLTFGQRASAAHFDLSNYNYYVVGADGTALYRNFN